MFKVMSALVVMMTLSLNSAFSAAHEKKVDIEKADYIVKAGKDAKEAEKTFDSLDKNKDGVLNVAEQK
jgi:Skp family chaperone for outer membrane proteins